jgi:DNA-binding XRE family transcriptional regulator
MKTAVKKSRRSARPSTTPWKEVRDRILSDPQVRLRYEEMKFQERIGGALAAARKGADLTQAEVAERAGTTQSAIARLEGGHGGLPSVALLDRIARAVGLQLILEFRKKRAA